MFYLFINFCSSLGLSPLPLSLEKRGGGNSDQAPPPPLNLIDMYMYILDITVLYLVCVCFNDFLEPNRFSPPPFLLERGREEGG